MLDEVDTHRPALVAAVLIPIAYVLARALTPLASAHAALLGALALALGLLAALGGLRILFAHGAWRPPGRARPKLPACRTATRSTSPT